MAISVISPFPVRISMVFPAVEFSVAHNPEIVKAAGLPADAGADAQARVVAIVIWIIDHAEAIGMSLVGLWILGVAARIVIPRLIGMWRNFWAVYHASELYAFLSFAKACRGGDISLMTKRFWIWADRLAPQRQVMTLNSLTAIKGGEQFSELAGHLAKERHGGSDQNPIDGRALLGEVTKIRHSILRNRSKHASLGEKGLNPRAAG